ncbi:MULTISPECIES: peroxiredoxin [unclassified Acidiphilium]|uniref:peroxiredoxin family protein n=1 Tax=unclassified Acidiphilium TaxID=2617493 RepID=UPI000461DFAC|nr:MULTISPECIES: redoxin domain-containing protein [unclassified Acidiphilium]KDM65698.1 putative oxidoreductase [Acidiphilium sp. JA12-A1]OYV54151.1 MAG: oxidoreductase [Acidiphilium sp. 20-67-58]
MTRPNASHGTALLASVVFLGLASATAMAAPTGKMGPTNAPAPQNMAARNAPFTVGGKNVELKTYLGHPLVVWQVTTWCPSCKAGLKTFAQHQAQIDKSDITIIVLRDYKNGGYQPDASMHKFVEEVAPKLLNDPHFVIGEDTKALFDLYNPHHYIDVYQVIAPDGRIAVDSSTPSATFGKIERFIQPKAAP